MKDVPSINNKICIDPLISNCFRIYNPQERQTEEGEKRKSFQIIAHSFEFVKTDGRGF
jgi:hypothetical protein